MFCIKIADGWIRNRVLGCWSRRPLCQVCHNGCPNLGGILSKKARSAECDLDYVITFFRHFSEGKSLSFSLSSILSLQQCLLCIPIVINGLMGFDFLPFYCHPPASDQYYKRFISLFILRGIQINMKQILQTFKQMKALKFAIPNSVRVPGIIYNKFWVK